MSKRGRVSGAILGDPGDPLALRRLFTLGPAPADHGIAVRCAIGVFVPMVALLLLGRLDLSVFAVFGAFTNLCGQYT